jgi:hypothetical protein
MARLAPANEVRGEEVARRIDPRTRCREKSMSEAMLVSGVVGVGITLLFLRLAAVERRLNRLSRLDAKVDALLRQAGIEFDPFQGVPADVQDALERGETILAIRRFRQATGAGLKEAKDFVDEVRRRRSTAGYGARSESGGRPPGR